jgi:hypothetical protein
MQIFYTKQGNRGFVNKAVEMSKKTSFHDIAVEKSNVANVTVAFKWVTQTLGTCQFIHELKGV